MAEKLNTKTLNIPDQVVDSDWKDDIDTDYATREDVGYEIYGDNEKIEGEYISPRKVSKESLSHIKDFQVKLAFKGLNKFRKQELAKIA